MLKRKITALITAAVMIVTTGAVPVLAENTETEDMPAYEETNSSEDMETRHEEALSHIEARHEEALRYIEARRAKEDEVQLFSEGEVELMAAGTRTVSGTITLPSKAAAAGEISVYLYEAVVDTDDNYIKRRSLSALSSDYVSVAKGASSVNYSLTAAEGEYIIGVQYSGSNPSVLGTTVYYSSNGAVKSEYQATNINLNKNTTINMSIPKAEHEISGTIKFKKPLEYDTYIDINLVGDKGSAYLYKNLKAGATSADFCIGADEDTYTLEYYCEYGDDWMYYGMNPTVWESCYYLNTKNKSYTGISLEYDNTNDEPDYEEDTAAKKINYTAKLPKAYDVDTQYRFYVYNTLRRSTTRSEAITVPAGATTFTGTAYTAVNTPVKVAIKEEASNEYWKDTYYYYDENNGFVNMSGNNFNEYGTEITIAPSDNAFTFDLSDGVAVEGSVSRMNYDKAHERTMEVKVVIGEEEFCAYPDIPAKAESAKYHVWLPASYAGSAYTVSAAALNGFSTGNPLAVSRGATVEGIVGSGTSDVSINTENLKTVTRKINFEEPVSAGGAVVEFKYTRSSGGGGSGAFNISSNDFAQYYVQAGATSFECGGDYFYEAEGKKAVVVTVTLLDENYSYSKRSDDESAEFTLGRMGRVSGKVYTPGKQAAKEAVNVSVNGYNMTIFPGESCGEYSFCESLDEGGAYIYLSTQSGKGAGVAEGEFCVMEDGDLSLEEGAYFEFAGDTEKTVDITLSEGWNVYGNIIVPEDFDGNIDNIELCVNNNGEYYNSKYIGYNISEPGKYEYYTCLPKTYTEYYLEMSMWGKTVNYIVDGNYYYTPWGITPAEYPVPIQIRSDTRLADSQLISDYMWQNVNVTLSRPSYASAEYEMAASVCLEFYERLFSDTNSIAAGKRKTTYETGIQMSYISEYTFRVSYILKDNYKNEYDELIYPAGTKLYVNKDGSVTTSWDDADEYPIINNMNLNITLYDSSALMKEYIENGSFTATEPHAALESDETGTYVTIDTSNIASGADNIFVTYIVASYDESNKLADVAIKRYALDDAQQSVRVDVPEGSAKCKVMLWNHESSMVPLSPMVEAVNEAV